VTQLAESINALRAFRPLAILQPLVGVAVGLVAYLLVSVGAGSLLNPRLFTSNNAWAVFGLVAFVIGFSEPRFVRVTDRLADLLITKDDATLSGAERTTEAM
jgi:hypothetical protein